MARRNKLRKFEELRSFPNVYENLNFSHPALTGQQGPVTLKGEWANKHFGDDKPVVLELACGGGEYTVGLAQRFPDKNFIGVDIKGARIWKGANAAVESGITNAAFLRTRIEQICCFFAPGEVAEIWITFPDPFLKSSKSQRRLTSSSFLDHYRQIVRPGGKIHLKTDDKTLYEFTLDTLQREPGCLIEIASDDIYGGEGLPLAELEISTRYEEIHRALGKTIKYIRFALS